MPTSTHSAIQNGENIRNLCSRLDKIERKQEKLTEQINQLAQKQREDKAFNQSNYEHIIEHKNDINTQIRELHNKITSEIHSRYDSFSRTVELREQNTDYKFLNNDQKHIDNKEDHRVFNKEIHDIKEAVTKIETTATTSKEHAEDTKKTVQWMLVFLITTSLTIIGLIVTYLRS